MQTQSIPLIFCIYILHIYFCNQCKYKGALEMYEMQMSEQNLLYD